MSSRTVNHYCDITVFIPLDQGSSAWELFAMKYRQSPASFLFIRGLFKPENEIYTKIMLINSLQVYGEVQTQDLSIRYDFTHLTTR